MGMLITLRLRELLLSSCAGYRSIHLVSKASAERMTSSKRHKILVIRTAVYGPREAKYF
jgi:hypothetical protein